MPYLYASQQVNMRLDLPQGAKLPTQGLANRANDSGRSFFQGMRFRKRAGHGISHRQPLLRAPELGDLPFKIDYDLTKPKDFSPSKIGILRNWTAGHLTDYSVSSAAPKVLGNIAKFAIFIANSDAIPGNAVKRRNSLHADADFIARAADVV